MRLGVAVLAAWVCCASVALAQNHYTLEMRYPDTRDSADRLYFAYPGIVYEIQAAVIGGNYPYTYALSNAPSGMSVRNATTGETCNFAEAYASPTLTYAPCGRITWTNPSSTASNVQLTVTDASGATDSFTWTITVGTSGWVFVDAAGGSDSNAGTLAAPWQTLNKVQSSAGANSRAYFRTGTYQCYTSSPACTRQAVGTTEESIDWDSSATSTIWICYPGDTCTLDFGHTAASGDANCPAGICTGGVEQGPIFYMFTDTLFIDSFQVRNCHVKCFHGHGVYGGVYWRNDFDDHASAAGGTNSSMIMTPVNGNPADGTNASGMIIQDNAFHDSAESLAVRFYSEWKPLIENNRFENISEAFDPKAETGRFTFRGNYVKGLSAGPVFNFNAYAVGGNMNADPGGANQTYGEILYNYIDVENDGTAGDFDVTMELWPTNEPTGDIQVYRNTLKGRINVGAVGSPTIYSFNYNVIVNADSGTSPRTHITYQSGVADASVTETGNLKGTSGAGYLDADGLLTGAARTTYCAPTCTVGMEVGQGSGSSSAGPFRLRLRGEP